MSRLAPLSDGRLIRQPSSPRLRRLLAEGEIRAVTGLASQMPPTPGEVGKDQNGCLERQTPLDYSNAAREVSNRPGSRRNAETVLVIIRERGTRGLPLERVYRLLFNRELYLLAYGRIYRNAGAMTPGSTPETVSRKTLVVCRWCHEGIHAGRPRRMGKLGG